MRGAGGTKNSNLPHIAARWKGLIEGISSPDDSVMFQGLLELSERLAMSNEDTMGGFPVDAAVPPLVNALNNEFNSEIALLAARCLANLVEVLPNSCAAIISAGAVGSLCAKLFNIEYIDVAEQSLSTLAKISMENPGALLREGGLAAVLMFLDFFPTGVQRTATQTAANISRAASVEHFDLVADAIPNLSNLLEYGDQKVVENTILAFCRLADALHSSPAHVEKITGHGMMPRLCALLAGKTSTQIGPAAQGQILRLLSALCQMNYQFAVDLWNGGLLGILHSKLGAYSEVNEQSGTPTSGQNEQLGDLLSLANELLPHLPSDMSRFVAETTPLARKLPFGKKVPPSSKGKSPPSTQETHPPPTVPEELVIKYGENLYVPLTKLFASTINPQVRAKCLSALTKVIHFSTPATLTELLREYPFSRFLATLLASPDLNVRAIGLCNAKMLMEKLPAIFAHYFQREGVVHEVQSMVQEPPPVLEDIVPDLAKAEEVREWLVKTCTEFLGKFFESSGTATTQVVEKLNSIADRLIASEASALLQLRDLLVPTEDLTASQQEASGITIHEFNQSKLFPALLQFLRSDKPSHVKGFGEIFMSLPAGQDVAAKPQQSFDGLPIQVFISSLQHIIAKFEQHPIYLNTISAATLKLLTQPLKLKLVERKQSTAPDPYSGPLQIPWHEHSVRHVEPARGWQCDTTEEQGNCRSGIAGFNQPPSINRFRCTEGCDYDLCEPCMRVHFPDMHLPQIVLIEPLASIRAVQQFLASHDPKVPPAPVPSEEDEDEDEDEESDVALSDVSPPLASDRPPFRVFLDGIALKPSASLVQVLQQHAYSQSTGFAVQSIWQKVHTLEYAPVSDTPDENEPTFVPGKLALIPRIQQIRVPESQSGNLETLFALLKVLYLLNNSWYQLYDTSPYLNPWLSPTSFISSKVPALRSPSSGTFPDWIHNLIHQHSHLFSFEVRHLYFVATALGPGRALQAIQAQIDANEQQLGFRVGRTARQKVRVSRENILQSARKIIASYGPFKAVLEIEYLGEVGTGLGPTLEFFTLVSRELQHKSLGLWYDESDERSEYVKLANGLYPRPRNPADVTEEDKNLWTFLGMFLGKAILDDRLLDLPLGIPFFKLLIGEQLDVNDILNISPMFGKSIRDLYLLRLLKERLLADSSLSLAERNTKLAGVASKIEGMMLPFMFPGTNWELVPNGANIEVTPDNFEQFLELLLDAWTNVGIKTQMDSLFVGLNRVIPSSSLQIFTPEELSRFSLPPDPTSMICGSDDSLYWTLEQMIQHTKCDHGYSQESRQVLYLFEAMQDLSDEERRQFLTFVTGSPRLPVGGWVNLHPRLTVVRRELTGNAVPDR